MTSPGEKETLIRHTTPKVTTIIISSITRSQASWAGMGLAISKVASRENRSHQTFHGESVHILQIGMGTNKTFLHREYYDMQVFLRGTTKQGNEPLRAIGVDPVGEWIDNLVPECQASDKVALIVGAVGGGASRHQIPLWSTCEGPRTTRRY